MSLTFGFSFSVTLSSHSLILHYFKILDNDLHPSLFLMSFILFNFFLLLIHAIYFIFIYYQIFTFFLKIILYFSLRQIKKIKMTYKKMKQYGRQKMGNDV